MAKTILFVAMKLLLQKRLIYAIISMNIERKKMT